MFKSEDKKPLSTTGTTASNPPPLIGTSIDCSQAEKRLWLVKVPKYLADKWNNAPDDGDVGSIRITSKSDSSGPEVLFHLNPALGNGNSIDAVPLVHKFEMSRIQRSKLDDQTIYILKQGEEAGKETLTTIGKVFERPECTPVRDDKNYLNLKRKAIAKAQEPTKKIITIEPVMNNFMPIKASLQKNDKDDKAKKLRKDKDEVMSILFDAFSKHQYYNIRDLERITKQPINYLKEILHEICRINVKGVHKNTWELKPEYRHNTPQASSSTSTTSK